MKIQSMPKEVVAELLHYLADFEPLEGLNQILGADFSLEDARAALRELAVIVSAEADQEVEGKELVGCRQYLSGEARHLLSSLSPLEEKKLLRAFGFLKN